MISSLGLEKCFLLERLRLTLRVANQLVRLRARRLDLGIGLAKAPVLGAAHGDRRAPPAPSARQTMPMIISMLSSLSKTSVSDSSSPPEGEPDICVV